MVAILVDGRVISLIGRYALSGLVGVACGAVQCGALWELLSFIQMRPEVIFCLSSVTKAPNSKFILHFDYIYDPL